jgi:hypothetical protein
MIRRVTYGGRRMTIRELAAALQLPPQAARWRVDHWPIRRWGEPFVCRMKLSLEKARQIRTRRRDDRGALAVEFDITRKRVGLVINGLSWKE